MTLPIAPQANQILEAGLALANQQAFLNYLNGKLSGPLSIVSGAILPAATTAVEQTLATFNLPASALAGVNQGVRVTAQGVMAATSNNKTVKLYFGSEVVSTGQLTTNNKGWVLELEAYKTGASAQQVNGWGYVDTTLITPYSATGTETDTSAITIKLNALVSTASSDVTLNKFVVEFLQ